MIWCLLLLLVTGCQRHNQWQYHHISERKNEATRILYRSEDPTSGIDLVLLKTHSQLVTYLQVPSKLTPKEEGKVEVKLHTPSKIITFLAHLHEGDQRVRLEGALQTALLSSLKEGNIVTLYLQGYKETIDPKSFQKVFQKLDHPPYKIPVHLPL